MEVFTILIEKSRTSSALLVVSLELLEVSLECGYCW